MLAQEALQIALQPIRCLSDGRVVGHEALARFAEETPDAMFAMADSVDLGLELELLAIRTALPLLDQLPGDTYLSVNASPALILDGRLGELLAQRPGVLDRPRPGGHRAPRGALLRPAARPARTAARPRHAPGRRRHRRRLRPFSHVLKLQPDIIKLDRSLISALDEDAAQRSLVIAVALLALDLDATLTAEGVETATQLAVLVDLGVDHGQGWHLGRPTLDVAGCTAPAAGVLATEGASLS